MARVAAQRGAEVTLVAANADLPTPAAVHVVRVGSAEELRTEMLRRAPDAEVVVMSAAVADFRPTLRAEHKIKKGASDPAALELVRNPDILAELVARRTPDTVIVGFAAETGDDAGDVLHHGRHKLQRKGCDLLVLNEVGEGRAFETEDNEGWLLYADGREQTLPRRAKSELASMVWDGVFPLLHA